MLLSMKVNRTVEGSSANNESGSCELLQVLDTLVGAAMLQPRTSAAAQVERAAAVCTGAHMQGTAGGGPISHRTEPASMHSRSSIPCTHEPSYDRTTE